MNEKLIELLRNICDDSDDTGCECCYVVSADKINAAKAFLKTLKQQG